MCLISLKSMTYAIKAKKALDDYYIDSEIVKLDPKMTKHGCAYGVQFNCVNKEQAVDALKKWSVRYTELIQV